MNLQLSTQLKQQLTLTPALCQSLAVLQMSALELEQNLQQQAEENPLLEWEEGAPPDYEALARYLDTPGAAAGTATTVDDEEMPPPWERSAAEQALTLGAFLETQLLESLCPQELKALVRFFIGCLDERGYRTVSVEEAMTCLERDIEDVQAALFWLQSLEPAGVGASGLGECLLLQLQRRGEGGALAARLIEKELLDDVAQGRWKRLTQALACTQEELDEALQLLRSLDPRPGRAFATAETVYVLPDVHIERQGGEFRVEVAMPWKGLTISQEYRKMASGGGAAVKEFVQGRLQAALQLLKSLDQRRQTLQTLAEILVRRQEEFFLHGRRHMKPLSMRQMADELGVHESTVSRTVAGKYALTPHGLLPLRDFFPAAAFAVGGESVAADGVKERIRALIQEEPQGEPLSDQKLCEMLSEEGIPISRRTVAKYREEMHIPSSAKRKRK